MSKRYQADIFGLRVFFHLYHILNEFKDSMTQKQRCECPQSISQSVSLPTSQHQPSQNAQAVCDLIRRGLSIFLPFTNLVLQNT